MVALVLGAGGAGAHPHHDDEAGPVDLGPIEVKGQVLESGASPYSSTDFESAQIRERRLGQTQELFRYVPGMAIRNFGLAGVADSIVIRGFGGGGHGGDLGAVIDGVPLNEAMSHADGYLDLNVVIPLEIATMNVFRGPVSALYGNYNRGGLIRIDTRKTGDYREFDLALGSDKTLDLQAAMGTPIGEHQQLNLAAQFFHTDGFRPQSQSDRGSFAGRWRISLSPRAEVALSARLHKADSDSAAYLPQALFEQDPYGIDPGVQNDGAEKDFANLRADFGYALAADLKLLGFAYATQQEFTRWFSRPVGGEWRQREESYDRSVFGAGLSLNSRGELAGRPLNWVAGLETFRESTDFVYYDGLDHRRRIAPAINDREARLNSVSAFGEIQAEWHPLFMPSVGFRYDRFSGGCSLNGPETGSDPCADLADMDNVSPKLGLSADVTRNVRLRASWSEGFALPNGFIKYAAAADTLDPVIFRQSEVGAHVHVLRTLQFDVVAYRLTSTDEVRTIAPGEYENFGETERTGVEASLRWLLPEAGFEFSAVYGSADSEVKANADAALIGNKVSGVPDYSVTVTASWSPAVAWKLDLIWRKVGEYAIDASNATYSDPYDIFDAGVAWGSAGRIPFKLYLQVENLTDEVYATSQSSLGVAPGAPRTFKVGVQLGL
ncbi:TonB-dependent receptor [Sinimarinibacterium flocculans]|nr:TonB-dependent receptor [Sinimarinibacterium flocculans]